MYKGNPCIQAQASYEIFLMIIEHQQGAAQNMASVGIVPKVFIFVIRIGIIGQTLGHTQLQASLEKIKIVVPIQPKVVPKGRIIGILIHKREARIWISKISFPFFVSIGFSTDTQNDAPRVIGNQMGDICIMQENGTVELVNIQHIIPWDFRVLGKTNACVQQYHHVK